MQPPQGPESVPPQSTAPAARAASRGDRLIALAVLGPCLTVLLLAASMTPNPTGMGTHQQLGLAACGFLQTTGLPCATCGMTTSFTHAAHADFVGAFRTQPAGAVLAALTAAAVVVSGYSLIFAAPLSPLIVAVFRPRMFLVLGALVILSWVYTMGMTVLG